MTKKVFIRTLGWPMAGVYPERSQNVMEDYEEDCGGAGEIRVISEKDIRGYIWLDIIWRKHLKNLQNKMDEQNLKIVTKDGRVVTLKKLFAGKEDARRQMAALSFKGKIKILISMQEIAKNWGRRKDVMIWRL